MNDAPDLVTFRAEVRSELARIVLPHAAEWEVERHVPAAAWRALGTAGLLHLDLAGTEFHRTAVVLDELGRTGFAGIRAAVGVNACMAAHYLAAAPGHAERVLAAVRRGEHVLALAITEEEAGSDLRRLRTHALAQPDGGYRLTGEKCFTANGTSAGTVLVLADTGTSTEPPGRAGGLPRAGLLLVDAGSPGVRREPDPLLGWRSADTCRFTFTDVAVPPGRLLGRPGRALRQLVAGLDFERLTAGLLALGGVAHDLTLLTAFVRGHRIGDEPLSQRQVVRHRIAEFTAEYDLLRGHAERSTARHADGVLSTRDATVLKLRATELAVEVARASMQLHGARGQREDADPARLYRDAVAGTVAAGASELLRNIVFDTAMGTGF